MRDVPNPPPGPNKTRNPGGSQWTELQIYGRNSTRKEHSSTMGARSACGNKRSVIGPSGERNVSGVMRNTARPVSACPSGRQKDESGVDRRADGTGKLSAGGMVVEGIGAGQSQQMNGDNARIGNELMRLLEERAAKVDSATNKSANKKIPRTATQSTSSHTMHKHKPSRPASATEPDSARNLSQPQTIRSIYAQSPASKTVDAVEAPRPKSAGSALVAKKDGAKHHSAVDRRQSIKRNVGRAVDGKGEGSEKQPVLRVLGQGSKVAQRDQGQGVVSAGVAGTEECEGKTECANSGVKRSTIAELIARCFSPTIYSLFCSAVVTNKLV